MFERNTLGAKTTTARRSPRTPTKRAMMLKKLQIRLLWLIFSWWEIPTSSSFQIIQHMRPLLLLERRTTRHAQKNNSNQEQPQLAISVNEFSRTIPPSRILKQHRSSSNFSIRIEANETERMRLAERFDLSAISHLSADLTLLRHGNMNQNNNGMIHVEGSCQTQVRQRCVRTNEDFDVTMEFPLYCVVRPVVPMLQQEQQRFDSRENGRKADDDYQRKNQREVPKHSPGNWDDLDVMELQKMLQTDIDEDILLEDEAVYAVNGLLDVGELVAQLFWLSLDPYPKKPGTDPVRLSITG